MDERQPPEESAPEEESAPANPPLNREQRRAARFRPKAGNLDPHIVMPPQDEDAGRGGDDQQSFAGGRGGDVVKDTGAGTGGATEDDGPVTHREGIHLGNEPNS